MSKLDTLLKIEGLTDIELAQNATFDGACYGICMNEGCDYTEEVEPDQNEGYCEQCETNTVKSGALLMGLL